MTLVNMVTFNLTDFQSIRLDYDADDIHVLEGESGKVILKEYMNEDKKDYYASATTQNSELFITEGKRPRRANFESYIELYIPADYSGGLALHSTSGIIKSGLPLQLSGDFSADTTSGTISISDVHAPNITITTTSGTVEVKASAASIFKIVSTSGNLSFSDIDADNISVVTTSADTKISNASGEITYKTTSGTVTMSDFSGSGNFNASGEGTITASFAEVTGDVIACSKNGTINLSLPSQLDFRFSATTKEGKVETTFDDLLGVTDRTAAGVVGASPTVSIELETRNGNIKVSK